MPSIEPEHIVIIGGGFSGVMTAVNLARLGKRPLRVTIVNHRRPAGRGVAYGLRRPEHLLNVAARNMSAFPEEPDHFLQWLRTRCEFDTVPEIELRERFIPRMVYGDYLRSLMQHHLQSPGGMTPVKTQFVAAEAVDIEPTGDTAIVRLAGAAPVEADRVVLATGNEPPAPLPGAEILAEHPAWVGDPWQPWEQRLPGHEGRIVILGTGLTTVDAIITLRALGWMGSIHAISRHGWFPHAHFRGIEYPDFPPAGVDLAELGLERMVALMQHHCAFLHEQNANPAIIVDKLRPHTQRIWSHFKREERLTFARDYAARWNIFRHRIAPEIHAQVTNSQLTGQLQIHAAGIERVEASGSRVVVHLQNGKSQAGDLVINATGPATRLTATRSVLLRNLLRQGLVAPDETDMGVRIDPDHTAITGEGDRSHLLLALGPLLRGTLWETVAVPELRTQARRVAETLLNQTSAPAVEGSVMMEYMI
ncbi:MAG TPA: FAD/NAD(P)-binding protein [Chthoniobacterales bacterium]